MAFYVIILAINSQRWRFIMIKKNYQNYLTELGKRLKYYRVNVGMTQRELEYKSGVSLRSISRFEQGVSIQLESLIKILCALDLENNLDLLIPDQTKRPSYYLNNTHRQRVRKSENNNKFKWGDEQE